MISAAGKYDILSPDSYRVVPWRNGRGQTLEILSERMPGSVDFAWRLSIATVDIDGPFSNFAGYNRTLVLLGGRGITLRHSTGQIDEIAAQFGTAHFSGDNETSATLRDGPITDFNIMSRRANFSTKVDILIDEDCNDLEVTGDILLVYAVDRNVRIECHGGEMIFLTGNQLLRTIKPATGLWGFSNGPVIAVQIHHLKVNRTDL